MRSFGPLLVSSLVVASAVVLAPPALASTSLEVGCMGASAGNRVGSRITLGLRLGPVQPSTVGADFALTLFGGAPKSGWIGTTALGVLGPVVDLDVAYAMSLSGRVALVPRLGTTALATVGEGGGGAAFGLNGGIGVVVLPVHGLGLRADVSHRWMALRPGTEGLWNISAGLVWPGSQGRREEPTGSAP